MAAGAEALAEVLIKVRAREGEMTLLERKAWGDFRWKTVRDCFLIGTGGATLGWFAGQKINLAGQKLNLLNRFIVSAGVAYICTFKVAADSLVNRHTERILSMTGTWMQQEMANALLKRNHQDPKLMGMLSKYFYAEKVYDDLSDEPKLSWRRRNFFQESNANFEASTNPDEHTPQSPNIQKPDQKRGPAKETNPSPKPAQMNNAVEVMENPFECIFGASGEAEEIRSSSVPVTGRSNTTIKRHSHGSRRHRHRRHRKHHHEASEAA